MKVKPQAREKFGVTPGKREYSSIPDGKGGRKTMVVSSGMVDTKHTTANGAVKKTRTVPSIKSSKPIKIKIAKSHTRIPKGAISEDESLKRTRENAEIARNSSQAKNYRQWSAIAEGKIKRV